MKVSQDSNRRGAFHSQPAMKILLFFLTKKKITLHKSQLQFGREDQCCCRVLEPADYISLTALMTKARNWMKQPV